MTISKIVHNHEIGASLSQCGLSQPREWGSFETSQSLETLSSAFSDTVSQKEPDFSFFDLESNQDGLFAHETIYFECSVVLTDSYRGCTCTSNSRTSGLDDCARNRWISDSLHVSREKHLLQGRGNWLLQSDAFRDWLEMNGRSFLWLQGSAGTGKSMLTSAVINALKSRTDGLGAIVAFFCCDGRFRCSNVALDILWSMLQALLSIRNADQDSYTFLQTLAIALRNAGDRMSMSQMRFLFSAMRHNLKSHETLFLILDGLDDVESLQSGADDLLPELLSMATSQDPQHRIKCFISTRPDYSQRVGLPGSRVDIDREPLAQDDLAAYVRQEVTKFWVTNDHQDTQALTERLISKSKGIFLWVTLAVRALSTETSSAGSAMDLLEASIRPGLHGIYDHMLTYLTRQDRNFMIPLLGLVSHSSRPFSVKELNWICHVMQELTLLESGLETETNMKERSISNLDLNICQESPFSTAARYVQGDISRISGGLLTLDPSQSVRLIHLSVHGYLRSLPQSTLCLGSVSQDPDEMLARACLAAMPADTLLQSLDLPIPEHVDTKPSKTYFPTLLSYAIRYWKLHYRLAESHSRRLPGALHAVLKAAHQTDVPPPYRRRGRSGEPYRPYHRKNSVVSFKALSLNSLVANAALMAASRFGFQNLAMLELQMGATSHIRRGPFEYTALHLAAQGNHLGIAKLLLQYDATPSVKTKNGQTPLLFAAAGGHTEMVNLLLDHNTQMVLTSNHASPLEHDSFQVGFQELELEATVSETCPNCGEMRAYYVLSILSDRCRDNIIVPAIHFFGESISRAEIGLSLIPHILSSHSTARLKLPFTEKAIVKWFPGVNMHKALALAAKRGMGDVRRLLIAAGNDSKIIDRFTSVTQLISRMSLG